MFSGQIEFEPTDFKLTDSEAINIAKQLSNRRLSDAQPFGATITEQHQLRLLQLSDAAELFALIEANRDYLKQWLSWLDTTQTVDDTRHFIRQTHHRARTNKGFTAAICYEGAIAGIIGLHDFHLCDRKSSIGYWLAEPYQGKGIMTASCKALINYAFNTLKLNRISILCASQNTRSNAIPKRLGFTHEGKLRQAQWVYTRYVDHEVYAILREEWSGIPSKQWGVTSSPSPSAAPAESSSPPGQYLGQDPPG